MSNDRWISGDAQLTSALRALYAAPVDDGYWDSLEARILAHVAHGGETRSLWSELAEMARPGLVAAAALILAASLALAHSRQVEVTNAYASVISPAPSTIEPATRAAAVGDGDAALHLLISR